MFRRTAQAGRDFFKTLIKGGKQKTTGTEVKRSFDPGTKFKGTPTYTKDMIKAKSEVQKKFKPINEGIADETRQIRQTLQGMRGERITQSGVSKGKDVTPGIYKEKKAKGGRIGYKKGTGLMKRKSNIQKIKETFGPKQTPQTRMTRKKKKFPDLTGDGKVTFADILKGRGVINGKKKKRII